MLSESSTSRNLSEIGHLFLSSVRDRQMQGAPMPRRQPPSRPTLSVPAAPQLDMSIALESEIEQGARIAADGTASGFPPVAAILGAHLDGDLPRRAAEYASQLALGGQRVGLITVDATELKITCFDQADDEAVDCHATPIDGLNPKATADALEELSCDLDRWLIVLPQSKTPEARELLGRIDHWVLISTSDHDGIVGCYRTLKGACDDHHHRISLALLGARSSGEGDTVYRKLAGVCQQFLSLPLERETFTDGHGHIQPRVALWCKVQSNTASAWQAIQRLIDQSQAAIVQAAASMEAAGSSSAKAAAPLQLHQTTEAAPMSSGKLPPPVTMETTAAKISSPATFPAMQPVMRMVDDAREPQNEVSQVLELPDGEATVEAILSAIMHSERFPLIECPVSPPMCPSAKLVVTRDRQLVLMAALRQGLGDLRLVGRAFNWLNENYQLICMAMPQMAINPAAAPCLRLMIDHADVSAELLQPMMQTSTVTVQVYRRLKWGAKTGLLVDAA
jgi:hypothetical protein